MLGREATRESGSRDEMEEEWDLTAVKLGVSGTDASEVGGEGSIVTLDFSTVVLSGSRIVTDVVVVTEGTLGFRTTIRTAWPAANVPMMETTPTASRRPPDSRLERTLWAPASMSTLPAGLRVWAVQDLRSVNGAVDGLNKVWGGLTGVFVPVAEGVARLVICRTVSEDSEGPIEGGVIGVDALVDAPSGDLAGPRGWARRLYWMTSNMFSGRLLDMMITDTPAPVAISAAMSLVSMPPVPRLEPSVAVLTVGARWSTTGLNPVKGKTNLTLLPDSSYRRHLLYRLRIGVLSRI